MSLELFVKLEWQNVTKVLQSCCIFQLILHSSIDLGPDDNYGTPAVNGMREDHHLRESVVGVHQIHGLNCASAMQLTFRTVRKNQERGQLSPSSFYTYFDRTLLNFLTTTWNS